MFGEKEVLRFYSDFPNQEALAIWYNLNKQFGQSAEALEAKWRMAKHWSGQGKFDKAAEFCDVALVLIKRKLNLIKETLETNDTILTVFSPPADTVMSSYKLTELAIRLEKLASLISGSNHTDNENSKLHLAKFVMLNPYGMDYSTELDKLLGQTKGKSPLRDNILLAKAMLTDNGAEKAEQLANIVKKFAKTDGAQLALYELAMLKIHLAKDPACSDDKKKTYLSEAKSALQQFCEVREAGFLASEAKKLLDRLPKE